MSGRRIVGTLCLVVVWAAFGFSGFCNAEEAAKGPAIKAGDKVRVINGPAPVKLGTKTIATVETGSELGALKVQGDWVQVTVGKGDAACTGWTKASKHLEKAPTAKVEETNGAEGPKEAPKDTRTGFPGRISPKVESDGDAQLMAITVVNETGGKLTIGLTAKGSQKEIKHELSPGKEATLMLRRGPYEGFYYYSEGPKGPFAATSTSAFVDKKERWVFTLNATMGGVERRSEP